MAAPSKHALVVGASSGIGLAVAKELAPIVAKLTLCSRSYPEELLKTIKADSPNLEVVHEKLDVSLMHEVRKFTTKHAGTQFDWIVMSPGIMTLNGRTETSEGLDVKMATHYYGRYIVSALLNDDYATGWKLLDQDCHLSANFGIFYLVHQRRHHQETMSATEQIQSLISSLETDLGIEANAPIGNDKKPQQQKEQKPKAPKPAKAPAADPNQPEITKLDIRVGKIVKVWKHETADKLYCEEIDVGEDEPRHIASGLVYHYSLEEMQDRRVLVLCNLKPRNLVGFRSHGMVMCAAVPLGDDKEKVAFVTPPEGAKIGERITFEGLTGEPFSPAQVEKKKVLTVLGDDMKTDDNGVAKWKEHVFGTSAGPCTAPVNNGVIR
ncbi:hypothetical protein JG688_00002066 [Phytophthora aleatoria]|uniref:tRNA-binding domain-containing protein n=1 Tax=Phytophthora aleatoria TaxID=2496075 RepID=A0A8J5IV42_9STRA|nr:hypothetical protein JG688_00002066 [Phytophthora aleatoria]